MQNLFIGSSSPVSGHNNVTHSQLTALTLFSPNTSNLSRVMNELEPEVEAIILKVQALIIAQTQKPLSHLQESILRGTIQGHTYSAIAEANYVSESHIKNSSAKLWEILSKKLGKEVNKTNFRSLFETINTDKLLSICDDHQVVINCSICPYLNRSHSSLYSSGSTKSDLKNAPALTPLYGRTQELETLQQAIASNTRLITIYGLVGIGKTALIRNSIENIQNQFDYILWYDLQNSANFTDFHTRFDALLSLENPSDQDSLIDSLQNQRCLIIFDNFHHLFTPQALAGKYRTETANWRQFLQQVTNLPHQNCGIIITQELPKEIDDMADNCSDLKILHLNGLEPDATSQILGEIGSLIDYSIHQGHPAYLKAIAFMNKNLTQIFREILAKKMPIFPEDLQPSFQEQFDRLSDLEQQIMLVLAQETAPINVDQLLESIEISLTDLVNVLQSLTRRGLLIKDDRKLSLESIVRLYLTVVKSI